MINVNDEQLEKDIKPEFLTNVLNNKGQRIETSQLPVNVIPKNLSSEEFGELLVKTFENADSSLRELGSTSVKRKDIITSFQNYLFAYAPDFYQLRDIDKNATAYKVICAKVYSGLRRICTDLDYSGNYSMIVESLQENELCYKLTVKLPNIVEVSDIVFHIGIVEAQFKERGSREEVKMRVQQDEESIVFTIMKDAPLLLALADAFNCPDTTGTHNTTFDAFVDEDKYSLPIIAGLQDEERPHITDLAKNSSIAICGTIGSGKSWAVAQLMFNIIYQSHPGDASFIVLDIKNDPMFRTIAQLPHVLTHCSDGNKFISIAREVLEEIKRRREILSENSFTTWSGFRDSLKDNPKELRKHPWLFVSVVELGALIYILEQHEKGTSQVFVKLLKEISDWGRVLGVRLVLETQRPDQEIFKKLLDSCDIKYAFRLVEKDLEHLEMQPEYEPCGKFGVAVFKDRKTPTPITVRTASIGGYSNRQNLQLIQMLACEWQMRVTAEELRNILPEFNLFDDRQQQRDVVLQNISNKTYF